MMKRFYAILGLLNLVFLSWACNGEKVSETEEPNIFCTIEKIDFVSNTTAEVFAHASYGGLANSFVVKPSLDQNHISHVRLFCSENPEFADIVSGADVPLSFESNQGFSGDMFVRLKGLAPGVQYYCVAAFDYDATTYYSPVVSFETTNRYIPDGAVDLGTPVLWASCNLGARTPEERGGYYAWGETKEKESYDWESFKWKDSSSLQRFYPDFSAERPFWSWDDAAQAALGGYWRIPTGEDFSQLLRTSFLTFQQETRGGVLGYKIENPHTEQSIFLPMCGVKECMELLDNRGGEPFSAYLSSMLGDWQHCFYLELSRAIVLADLPLTLSCGFPVRPVYDDSKAL